VFQEITITRITGRFAPYIRKLGDPSPPRLEPPRITERFAPYIRKLGDPRETLGDPRVGDPEGSRKSRSPGSPGVSPHTFENSVILGIRGFEPQDHRSVSPHTFEKSVILGIWWVRAPGSPSFRMYGAKRSVILVIVISWNPQDHQPRITNHFAK
jgi:hypothetical protein